MGAGWSAQQKKGHPDMILDAQNLVHLNELKHTFAYF